LQRDALISIKLRSGKHIAHSAVSFGKLIPSLGGMGHEYGVVRAVLLDKRWQSFGRTSATNEAITT
jgi:hypothetical protein